MWLGRKKNIRQEETGTHCSLSESEEHCSLRIRGDKFCMNFVGLDVMDRDGLWHSGAKE